MNVWILRDENTPIQTWVCSACGRVVGSHREPEMPCPCEALKRLASGESKRETLDVGDLLEATTSRAAVPEGYHSPAVCPAKGMFGADCPRCYRRVGQ